MDKFALRTESVAAASESQGNTAFHRLETVPEDLRKKIIALENENANLQLLICHLLKRNEELRAALYQQ